MDADTVGGQIDYLLRLAQDYDRDADDCRARGDAHGARYAEASARAARSDADSLSRAYHVRSRA